MTPKPLGYYGLKFEPETEQAIEDLPLHYQIDLAKNMINDLWTSHYLDNDDIEDAIEDELQPIEAGQLSDLDKIGLIRGLCDRIEAKLMEDAE